MYKKFIFKEDQLFLHWNKLNYWLSDVKISSRKYVIDLTTQLSDLGSQFEEAMLTYNRRENEIFKNAEQILEQKISDKFKEHRLKKLKEIQLTVQIKVS